MYKCMYCTVLHAHIYIYRCKDLFVGTNMKTATYTQCVYVYWDYCRFCSEGKVITRLLAGAFLITASLMTSLKNKSSGNISNYKNENKYIINISTQNR